MLVTQHEILGRAKDLLTPALKSSLYTPLTLIELTIALEEMENFKSPPLDGTVIELFKQMLEDSIIIDNLPPGVTFGLIVQLHKGGGGVPSIIDIPSRS